MLVLLLSGLLAAVSLGASSPAWSPDGAHVGFVHDGGVYIDGRWLAAGGAPAWAPDGARLAWVDGGRLLVGPADGSAAPVQLAEGLTGGAAWSPDGSQLAFERRAGADAALMTVDAAGGAPLRLGPGASSIAPVWQGSTIAYVDDHRAYLWPGHRLLSKATVMSALSRHAGWTVFSGPKGITAVNGTRVRGLGKGSGPAYSADGARIVFTLGTALWQMNADGTCRRRLGPYTGAAWKPASPSGRIRC